ncbi:MAG: hypothetical protein ACHQO8_07520 [Vicinamibacterales bacterium]
MAITTIRCPVNQAVVSRLTDLEGEVTRVICPEYEEPTGICRLKRNALQGGPLAQLLERVSEDTLDTDSVKCTLH